jgi:peroxiredoxin
MAAFVVRQRGQGLWKNAMAMGQQHMQLRQMGSAAKKIDLESDVALQEARTWDEGVSTKFSTTPVSEIFKGKKVAIFGLPGAFTGVCSQKHVPSFLNNSDKLKSKGIDSIVCVSVNDPYTMNAWAEKLGAKDKIKFYGDFDGKFHKSLGLDLDLSGALLGPRSQRYAAVVEDGKIKQLNVEEVPSDFKVSDAETLLKGL